MSVITITKDNFESEVLKSPVPVLLDFWATWCGPCRMVSPIVDEIAEESDGSYKVGKINVDEQPELASQFRVMSIPTLVVMKDGRSLQVLHRYAAQGFHPGSAGPLNSIASETPVGFIPAGVFLLERMCYTGTQNF